MKKQSRVITLLVAVMIAYAALCSSLALSAPGVRQYGPFHSTSPDSGTCGNDWATDTFDRFFKVDVTPNSDGTYNVVEEFKKGTFVTVAGASPGGCETNPGGVVAAGVTGKMQGSFNIVVSGGTFNPTAVCDASCGTTAGFIAKVFGTTANYDIP